MRATGPQHLSCTTRCAVPGTLHACIPFAQAMEGPSDSSDDSDDEGAERPPTYVEEQEDLKHAFLQASCYPPGHAAVLCSPCCVPVPVLPQLQAPATASAAAGNAGRPKNRSTSFVDF